MTRKMAGQQAMSGRRGISATFVIGSVVAVAAIGAVLLWFITRSANPRTIQPILGTVTRGEFVAQVLEQGEVQSSENIEIRCNVRSRGGSVGVIEVVPEGTQVSAGDFLVRLDSSSFESEREQQRITVSNAEIAVIQAKAAYDAAVASRRQYVEGQFVESKKSIENEIYNAEQELQQAEAYLAHSRRLHQRGFISTQQLNGDEIAVQRARNSLELAEQRLHVLENITRDKELIRLDSDIAAAEVQLKNREETLTIERQKLADIQQQIDNCVILVPPGVSGEVVYAKEIDRRGGSEWVLEPGAQVRERQVLIRLPNRRRMEVKTLIKEQSITSVRLGMPARIRIDAISDQTLLGVVTRVNQYAEPPGWMSTGAREYAAFVRIIDPPEGLIPGMNASVAIQTMRVQDALQAPVQSVYAVSDRHFVLRQRDNHFETVEVKVGANNSQEAMILEGLEEGDQLVMTPGNYKDLLKLPDIPTDNRIDLPEDVVRQASTTGVAPTIPDGGSGAFTARGPGGERNDRTGRDAGGPGGGGFSPEAMVSRIFDQLDTNHDGILSADEIAAADDRLLMLIQRADVNGDGEVTREQLLQAARQMATRMRQGSGPFAPGSGADTGAN